MSDKQKNYSNSIISFLVIIVSVYVISFGINSWYPKVKTNRILQDNIYSARANDWQTCTNLVDGWGRPIDYVRWTSPTLNVYIMKSYGKDGVLSDDDITVSLQDINKSRVVGEWLGKKTHEAAIGAINGWKEKSKFKGE